MSLSSFCIEQRNRETQQLKSFLTLSLVGSALLHAVLLVLGSTIPWERAFEPEAEPIEIAVVEPTKPQEKQEKETELEAASGSPESNPVLSGTGGGSFGTPSAKRTQETSPRQSTVREPSQKQPEPDQTSTSRQRERTETPKQSVQPKTESLPQNVPQPIPPPVVALKPKPERETTTRQSPTPEREERQSTTSESKPIASPPPEAETPSAPQNEEPKPEERQEAAQKPIPLPASPTEVTPRQSSVTTADAGLSSNTQPAPESRDNGGNDQDSQAGEAGENSGNNALAGISRGDREGTGDSGEASGTGSGSGTGTGSSTGTGTASGTGSSTGSGNGTVNQPGNDSAKPTAVSEAPIATGPLNNPRPIPSSRESDTNPSDRGSNSRGLVCRDCPEPNYPRSARRRGIEGDTRLTFDVDEKGRATNVRVARSSGNEELDRAAVEAAQRWRLDSSASRRQNVSSTVAFELEGSRRQRQNRERRRQREEAQRNSTPANSSPRVAETTPRQSTTSTTNANTPSETRRTTRITRRQASPRRSESATATTPRRRQQAAAPTPRRRQQAAATPRRRQQAAAPTPKLLSSSVQPGQALY